jgi:hypothetical protein
MSDERALVAVNGAEAEAETEDEADFTDVRGFEQIIADAKALARGDAKGALRLLLEAAVLGFTDIEAEGLVAVIHKATGIGVKKLRDVWKVGVAEVKKRQWEAAAAARAAADIREAEEAQRRQREERERLWASSHALAESPTLLDEMVKTANKLGLVNEAAGARSVYLTCTSRLLAIVRCGCCGLARPHRARTIRSK